VNKKNIKILLATDHAGFELKNKLTEWLIKNKYEIEDCGAHKFDKNDDYSDFVKIVAKKISKNPKKFKGIILGGSGQGEAIFANRFKNIRAATIYNFNEKIVRLCREHNDANIISLGARFLSFEQSKKIIKIWLNTKFLKKQKYSRRIKKMDI
jgi:ribose 5-phosphate isomerase B